MSVGPQDERTINLKNSASKRNKNSVAGRRVMMTQDAGGSTFGRNSAHTFGTQGGVPHSQAAMSGGVQGITPFNSYGHQNSPAIALSFLQAKHQEETRNLKAVIQRLCKQLSFYQAELKTNLNEEEGEDVGGADEKPSSDFDHLLSGHVLGPLFKEYEAQVRVQSEEIKTLQNELRTS